MKTASARIEQPLRTLADFWSAANIEDMPSWAKDINLSNKPFKHQIGDLNHLAVHVRSMNLSDPGTGKTLSAQAHILWLVTLGNKAIATMPPVLCQQFYQSFHRNFQGIGAHVSVALFEGNVEARNHLIEGWNRHGWPDVLIMSYAMFEGKSLTELAALQRKREQAALRQGQPVAPFSAADQAGVPLWLSKGYNHLTLDESTAVKHPTSGLHKAVAKFVGKDGPESNGLVLLTGSPVENDILDIYGQVKLVTPDRYKSFRAFEFRHCVYGPGRFPKVVAFANVDYAYESLYLHGRRVTKKDALDLPPRVFSEILIDLHPKHKALYDKLVRQRMIEIGDRVIDATTASSLYNKTQRTLLCPELFTEAGWKVENTLLTALDEIIHSLGGRKLVVFAWFTESVNKLATRYQHLNPAILYGGTTDREAQKKKFLEDDTCKVLFANPRSGGVGVDQLQTVCSHCVFIEPIGIPGLFDQALSRLHRAGQKAESVTVYLLTVRGTVSVKIRNSLVRKEGEANSVVRDSKQLLADLTGKDGIQGTLE